LDVSCIVLAGGKSKRLGRNKVTEKIGNISLIENVVSRLAELKTEIIVVISHDSIIPQLSQYPGVRIIEDIYPGKGTLGGIYSGLAAVTAVRSIVVACDMPFLNVKMLRYMADAASEYDVVVTRSQKGVLEPLHAIYSKTCLEKIKFLIQANRLSVLELYPLVKIKYIDDSETRQFDPDNLSFFNINTEADLQKGRELASQKDILND
jgi:molybdopterin-guanine dinucleotide biosynthesis protein A